MSDLARLREAIDRWDGKYNGYVKRTDPIVDAWAIMLMVRGVVNTLVAERDLWKGKAEALEDWQADVKKWGYRT